MSGKEYEYEIRIGLSHMQLLLFHVTMKNAHKHWPGGDAREQVVLEELKNQTWKLLMEAQFKG